MSLKEKMEQMIKAAEESVGSIDHNLLQQTFTLGFKALESELSDKAEKGIPLRHALEDARKEIAIFYTQELMRALGENHDS